MLQLFEDKGAKFVFGSSPARFLGSDNKITEVELENGTKLPADLCVIGIGIADMKVNLGCRQ